MQITNLPRNYLTELLGVPSEYGSLELAFVDVSGISQTIKGNPEP